MIIIFFRRPILTVGLFLLVGGIAGLAGDQGGLFAGYRLAEGSGAGLIGLMGLGLVTFELVKYFRAGGGPPEQSWEPVVDEGIVQAINGNWEEAMARFQKAISMAGPDPRRLRAAERIAKYLESRGRTVDAIAYLHTALALRDRMFGAANPGTRALRQRLAELHRSTGDMPGAASLLAAELDVAAPGDRVITLDGADVASRLAGVLYQSGDYDGARDLSQKAILAIEQTDPYSSQLVGALVASARAASAAGDVVLAESQLKRAMGCADRAGSEEKMNTVRRALIELYVKSGREAEAIPLSEKLLRAGTGSRVSPDVLETARMNREHAALLETAGRHGDAARYVRVAETLERLSGGRSAVQEPTT